MGKSRPTGRSAPFPVPCSRFPLLLRNKPNQGPLCARVRTEFLRNLRITKVLCISQIGFGRQESVQGRPAWGPATPQPQRIGPVPRSQPRPRQGPASMGGEITPRRGDAERASRPRKHGRRTGCTRMATRSMRIPQLRQAWECQDPRAPRPCLPACPGSSLSYERIVAGIIVLSRKNVNKYCLGGLLLIPDCPFLCQPAGPRVRCPRPKPKAALGTIAGSCEPGRNAHADVRRCEPHPSEVPIRPLSTCSGTGRPR